MSGLCQNKQMASSINEDLFRKTVQQAPSGDLHVFAYGSLMWRPGFRRAAAVRARIFGFHRRLCVYSTHYRGTPQKPGLVFGLDYGGSCNGMLFRVAAADKHRVIRYLFKREMFSGVYVPRYVAVQAGRHRRRALTFVARRDGAQYAAVMADAAAVRIIHAAAGVGGRNADYILQTQAHLQTLNIPCPMLARYCRLLIH